MKVTFLLLFAVVLSCSPSRHGNNNTSSLDGRTYCLDGKPAFRFSSTLVDVLIKPQSVYPSFASYSLKKNKLYIHLNNGDYDIYSCETGTLINRMGIRYDWCSHTGLDNLSELPKQY